MELRKLSILIVAVIAVAAMWYLPQDSTDKLQQPGQIYTDSIDAPDRPMITAQKDTQDTIQPPPPVGEDFAPGTALIRATIRSLEANPGILTITVNEVMGYGPSTPPIPVGTELTFDITNFLKNKEQLRAKSEIKMLIASQQGLPTAESDNGQQWMLVDLKE